MKHLLLIALIFNLVLFNRSFAQADVELPIKTPVLSMIGENVFVAGVADDQMQCYLYSPDLKQLKKWEMKVKKAGYVNAEAAGEGVLLLAKDEFMSSEGNYWYIDNKGEVKNNSEFSSSDEAKKFREQYKKSGEEITYKECKSHVSDFFSCTYLRTNTGQLIVTSLLKNSEKTAGIPEKWPDYSTELILIDTLTGNALFKKAIDLKQNPNWRPFASKLFYNASEKTIYVSGNYFDISKVKDVKLGRQWDMMHGFFVNKYDIKGDLLASYTDPFVVGEIDGISKKDADEQMFVVKAISQNPDGTLRILGENMVIHTSTSKNNSTQTVSFNTSNQNNAFKQGEYNYQVVYSTFGLSLYTIDKSLKVVEKSFTERKTSKLKTANIGKSGGNFSYTTNSSFRVISNQPYTAPKDCFVASTKDLSGFIYRSGDDFLSVAYANKELTQKPLQGIEVKDNLFSTYKPTFISNNTGSGFYAIVPSKKVTVLKLVK